MQRRRFWTRLFFVVITLIITGSIAINVWVSKSVKDQLYSSIESLPHNKVGLLLGTARKGWKNNMNTYYRYRIEAAVSLFKAGKIDYILVSGDNRKESYNEPEDMLADLIAAGVPADKIVLDYAGFRTLDSILRCKEVFGEDNITIISQQFHNERALFIANNKGVRAIAFNAQDVATRSGIKTQGREKLARVKMALDLLFNKGPKFYGPKVKIG